MRVFAVLSLFCFGLLGLAVPASAGDMAKVQVLGFSEDGRYFAFEQYGIQDGSGFPYSEIFVLDVFEDSWVRPSPFRQRDEIDDSQGYDPDALLQETRAQNRLTAQQLLQDKGIAGKGETVGHSPVTELSADPYKMTVNLRPVVPPIDDPMDIELQQFPMPDATCASYGVETAGFQLNTVHGGEARVRHADTQLPKSRGCAIGYRIERVVSYFPDGKPPVLAILVQVLKHGFEGPDGRILAITGRL
ncbi:DUF2259 domain-containing protein [Roseibium denhamense]|uniref:Predicted secreted protein n=1 Tax=Roseibium denhamense TaxID=76305 RepID=A0ABY1N6N8_9HYPH|nr:DUF2259 domain-containing protein [Roseibium denhamense]MTI06033.1 DUF2259 domain-containing protein [Roseibium denhamense]SMP01889.1 Predicted secreted protein [Roseibium denhamense]